MDIYKLMVVHWSIFTLSIQLIYCASVYSNVDSPMHPTESICKTDEKLYVKEREVESSLIYDLHPGDIPLPCKTILSALKSNGFIVRLHKPKAKKSYGTSNRSKSETGARIRNSTSCPLNISFLWDQNVRKCEKRERKRWMSSEWSEKQFVFFGHALCPNGNEYDSDEDPDLCLNHKNNLDFKSGNVFQHIAKEIRKIFPQEENVSVLTPATKMTIVTSTSLDAKRDNRPSLTRGLSRYGPWGYLMLGMLLCGGALLICGLWECCFRHKKPTIPPDFGTSTNAYSVASDFNSAINSSSAGLPSTTQINYDEIDPPPSYAALFRATPNQKLTNDSNDALSTSAPQVENSTTLPSSN